MIIVEGVDHINLAVTNLDASSKFYSDLFDFEVIKKTKSYVMLSLEPINLKLVLVEKVENPLSSKLIPTISFSLDVDDFTEAIQEIESNSIKIVKGPEGAHNGEYLIISDPDNNLIELFYKD